MDDVYTYIYISYTRHSQVVVPITLIVTDHEMLRGSEVKQWSVAKIRHHDVWEAFSLARVWGPKHVKSL